MAENRRLVSEYIGALRLYSIGIVSAHAEAWSKVISGDDLDRQARELEATTGKTLAVSVYWVRDKERAQLVIAETRSALGKIAPRADAGGFQTNAADAAIVLVSTAESLGAMLTPDQRLREEAEAAVAHSLAQFEELKARGGLKSLNKGYREYRVTSSQAGLKFVGYSTWIEKYLAGVIAAAAEHSRIAY